MALAFESGARLGPYEILSPAGAGGMGEVYRARDTRLDRTVAIKVLPTGSADNPDLRQRFDREAKAISSLNHPHICVLYDVGHQDGTDYLVMEYLEGETLATRLEKGPLPSAEVLRYAVQISDALDKAHRQGLVHRDLKPGNIMLTKAGAKLLDFGLAKLVASGDVVQGITGVTRTTPLTGEGTILGTLHYMPPEQLEGAEADARSDIFAFGCVLYEMATGKRAFEGKSQASLIAAIMGKDPAPVSTISQVAPPALDRIVSRCIAKDPDDRWQTARDLMHELQWLTSGSSQTGTVSAVSRRRRHERWAWPLALVSLAVAAGLGAYLLLAPHKHPEVVRSSILAPEGTRFMMNFGGQHAVSPDGRFLAFVATDTADGEVRLWVRPLRDLVAMPLPGTDGAYLPFWSPDSRHIAFFASGKLKKIQSSGGPVMKICDAPEGRGGTWSKDGVILFCPDFMDVLYRVPAAGGTPVVVTVRDTLHHDFTHRWPHFLPDGNRFLYFARTGSDAGGDDDAICVGSLDGKTSKRLVQAKSDMMVAGGHMLFVRDNNLMTQPFDVESAQLAGEPVPIADDVSFSSSLSRGFFSVSQTGILVYQTGAVDSGSTLVVFDRRGLPFDTIGVPQRFFAPRFSPDGKKLLVDINDPSTGNDDIWIYDIARGIRTRFTFDSAGDYSPVWSPDGTQVAFASERGGSAAIYLKNSSGVEEERPTSATAQAGRLVLFDWSEDGRYLAYTVEEGGGESDIWILPLGGDSKPFRLMETDFAESWPAFSPDGRWIAYMSTESGKEEVYVASFPQVTSKWQVSIAEGDRPVWRRDGKELYYMDNGDRLMAAEVDGLGEAFRIGSVTPLFLTRPQRPGRIYDVTSDGQGFLVNTRPSTGTASALTMVLNWQEELEKP